MKKVTHYLFVCISVFTGIVQAGYPHPFMDTTAGNVWEYRYKTVYSYFGWMMMQDNISNNFEGTFSLRLLNGAGQVKITVKGTDSCRVTPFDPSMSKIDVKKYDTSFTVLSLEDLDISVFRWVNIVSSRIAAKNPFYIDSLFIKDSSQSKRLDMYMFPTVVQYKSSFHKATFQNLPAYRHTLEKSKNIYLGDNYSYDSDSTVYLEKYGLIRQRTHCGESWVGSSGGLLTLTLVSFNGKPFDESQVVLLNQVSVHEVETAYPKYALDARNPVTLLPPRHINHTLEFSQRAAAQGTVLHINAPNDYSVVIVNALGKAIRAYSETANTRDIVLSRNIFGSGIYFATLKCGESTQRVRIKQQ
jgi:hypothetical protein